MKKVWIAGANGQLGKSLQDVVKQYSASKNEYHFLSREDLDISNPKQVSSFFSMNSVDCLVNCAAYTAVDKAESEVEKAFAINAEGVKNLAKNCQLQNAELIHISTDYVFDGMASRPYLPKDSPNPINVYGKSKLEGEKQAIENNSKTIVIRTSWVYSEYGTNFHKTMLRLMAEQEEIRVVSDQIGKPTYAGDLAKYIFDLIENESSDYGIHHFSGKEQMSWYEFAVKIAKENQFTTRIIPISTEEFPTPAKRPKWSVLG